MLEFDLDSGALERGDLHGFEDLQGVLAKDFANEAVGIWPIPLRFSSITDRMPVPEGR